MADTVIDFRANLSAAKYPFKRNNLGPTVLDPGADQAYDRRLDPEGSSYVVGIPQAIYMDNVMPTPEGFQTVDAVRVGSGSATSSFRKFDLVASVLPSPGVYESFLKIRLVVRVDGFVYLETLPNQPISATSAATNIVGIVDAKQIDSVQLCVVGMRAFGLVRTLNLEVVLLEFTYFGGLSFGYPVVAPTGFLATNKIMSGCGAFNYLILADENTVYYSSLINPVDFTTSAVSGAGSINPLYNTTNIVHLQAAPFGFYIFTATTIIQANYTGNAAYPWRFIPIEASGIVPEPENCDVRPENDFAICCNSNGNLFALSGDSAQAIAPELSSFLERTFYIELYNYSSEQFELWTHFQKTLALPGYIRTGLRAKQVPVKVVDNRYICVSIARSAYNHIHGAHSKSSYKYEAIVIYDKVLKKYGRIRIPHTQMFDTFGVLELYDASSNHSYYVKLNPSETFATISGSSLVLNHLLVLGRFSLQRGKSVEVQEIGIESSLESSLVTTQPSVKIEPLNLNKVRDGFDLITPTLHRSEEGVRVYHTRWNTSSFNVLVFGQFELTSVTLKVLDGGMR